VLTVVLDCPVLIVALLFFTRRRITKRQSKLDNPEQLSTQEEVHKKKNNKATIKTGQSRTTVNTRSFSGLSSFDCRFVILLLVYFFLC
jgi:hypothetical protein